MGDKWGDSPQGPSYSIATGSLLSPSSQLMVIVMAVVTGTVLLLLVVLVVVMTIVLQGSASR